MGQFYSWTESSCRSFMFSCRLFRLDLRRKIPTLNFAKSAKFRMGHPPSVFGKARARSFARTHFGPECKLQCILSFRRKRPCIGFLLRRTVVCTIGLAPVWACADTQELRSMRRVALPSSRVCFAKCQALYSSFLNTCRDDPGKLVSVRQRKPAITCCSRSGPSLPTQAFRIRPLLSTSRTVGVAETSTALRGLRTTSGTVTPSFSR
jgi:hypothetical protein